MSFVSFVHRNLKVSSFHIIRNSSPFFFLSIWTSNILYIYFSMDFTSIFFKSQWKIACFMQPQSSLLNAWQYSRLIWLKMKNVHTYKTRTHQLCDKFPPREKHWNAERDTEPDRKKNKKSTHTHAPRDTERKRKWLCLCVVWLNIFCAES